MRLNTEQVKAVYRGAYTFAEKEGGWLAAYQFTQSQMEYFRNLDDTCFFYDRCMASNAKTLDFYSDSRTFSLEYRIIWEGSPDSFELALDGLIADIRYMKDMKREGRLVYSLPEGNKRVTLYLPADATVLIRNVETDAQVLPVTFSSKVLWLGDSITQGYGPLRSGMTYVSVARRELDWDVLNQGIGGYVYDAGSLMDMPGYTPDKIVVALGTNQYKEKDLTSVRDYYRRLTDIYGQEIPVMCVTPIWREGTDAEQLRMKAFSAHVAAIAGAYLQITVVNGFDLIPHCPEYFLDGLHPNALGCEVYGRNLAKIICSSNF